MHAATLPPPGVDPTMVLTVVEQTQPDLAPPAAWNPGAGGAWVVTNTDQTPLTAPITPLTLTPLVVMAAIGGLLAVVACFLDLFTIESDVAAFLNATVRTSDVFSNITVAMIIGAVVTIGGAALGSTGRRIGTGLAGGAGLAIAGMSMLAIGTVISTFDQAELVALDSGADGIITFTREPGFWVLLVAAAAGVVTFAMSLREARPDGRSPLSQGVGALGALGAVAVTVGPLIPQSGASFGDNVSLDTLPPAFLYLRLGSLVLIGVCGVVGFLNNRRWGVGVALGGVSIALWLWFTTQTEQGDNPAGVGIGNFGADSIKPHVVTTLGLAAMLVAAALMLTMAAQTRTVPNAP